MIIIWTTLVLLSVILCPSYACVVTHVSSGFEFQEDETPLHCAAARGHTDCIRSLLDAGVDLNLVDKVSAQSGFYVLISGSSHSLEPLKYRPTYEPPCLTQVLATLP